MNDAGALSILLSYQRAWVADRAPVKVYEKSRRIGISWTEAADCVLSAGTAGHAGQDVSYVGYDQEMAREFIDDCAYWSRRIHDAAVAVNEFLFDDSVGDDHREIKGFRIDYPSGHHIVALSSRPRNFRSREGIAVLDEAAFHENLPELLKAALAFVIWGGSVRIISTHNGTDNPFNELITDIRAGRKAYSIHRTDFDDALKAGLFHKICERTGKSWSVAAEAAWRQEIREIYRDNLEEELYCVPVRSAGAYLPSALVEGCMRAEIPIAHWSFPQDLMMADTFARYRAAEDFCAVSIAPMLSRLDPNAISVFGEDFGRSPHGDLTVIWPLQVGRGMVRRTPFIVELSGVPFKQQEQVLFYILDRLPKLTAGAMDARGNGQYLAEQAALKYGDRIEQVMLSVDWYRERMPRYKRAFEDRLIELPKDPDILTDHRAVKMERGVAQVPDVRTRGASGETRHGDSAIAGALAWYASEMDPPAYTGYRSAPARMRFGDVRSDDERGPAVGAAADYRAEWERARGGRKRALQGF